MTRFVIIIIFIVVGYYAFHYLTRTFKQETYQKSEGSGDRYQNWEHANTEDEYRQTLGITADDDLATIRKKYKELLSKMPDFDFSKIVTYELRDETEVKRELACVSGVCDIV